MSVVEMEVFSNTQLIILTILMFIGGEVFTSMVGLLVRGFLGHSSRKDGGRVNDSMSDLGIPPNFHDQLELGSIGNPEFESSKSDIFESGYDSERVTDVEELKYKSLKFLGLLALGYLFFVQTLGVISVYVYLNVISSAKNVLKQKGLNTFTFSLFTIVSTFASCGFVPTNENMMVFSKNSGLLLLLIPQVLLDSLMGMNNYQKFMGVLFQTINTRHTGETIVDLSTVAAASLVLIVVMMYLPPYTSFLPLSSKESGKRNSDQRKKKSKRIVMGNMVFSQLSYLVIFIILICITERRKIKDDPLNFSVLNIVFEVISAYGNVGFTTGYSCGRQLKPDGICENKWEVCVHHSNLSSSRTIGKTRAMPSTEFLVPSDMEAISVLLAAPRIETKLIHLKADRKRYGSFKKFDNPKDCVSIIQSLKQKELPHIANELVPRLQAEGFLLDNSTLTALMMYYAKNGFFTQANALWHEILNSAYNLDIHVVSDLIDAYIGAGIFNEVIRIVHEISVRHPQLQHQIYVHTVSSFGKIGELELMEYTLKEMVSKGFCDSSVSNAYMVYYSRFGSITMMENAYKRLKSSSFLIEKNGIRAVSVAYIRDKKFHSLGNFLRDVGLGRRNCGNLLWNLLLLSYAANFKMKSLQREFLNMVEAGFYPDLTTFNIRAVAFSKMSLFWDLHLSLEHMNHNGILPDLVTYGCVVDAYMDRRLGRNLDFASSKMNVKDSPIVLTDRILFEVFGKGDFHSSSEALLEFNTQKTWTYKNLIAIYLKKKYRSSQVFWNY
ncbi:hypothetical protein E3N88_41662 [Mikania micrantha]|nr:hypothetical protein E3N88_41662 [Mikania micrantha]